MKNGFAHFYKNKIILRYSTTGLGCFFLSSI